MSCALPSATAAPCPRRPTTPPLPGARGEVAHRATRATATRRGLRPPPHLKPPQYSSQSESRTAPEPNMCGGLSIVRTQRSDMSLAPHHHGPIAQIGDDDLGV